MSALPLKWWAVWMRDPYTAEWTFLAWVQSTSSTRAYMVANSVHGQLGLETAVTEA